MSLESGLSGHHPGSQVDLEGDNIPPLSESITDFLGTQEFVLLDAFLHIRSKVEDIVLAPFSILLYDGKSVFPSEDENVKGSLLCSRIHGRMAEVVIKTDTSSLELEFLSLDDLEHAVIHMVTSLKKVIPNSSPGDLLQNASPILLGEIQGILDSLEEMLKENQGPCGGFSKIYAALCDYSGLPFRQEIQWDVDNIYQNQECREFNLLDFNHLQSQDLALSVAGLSYNQWFTRLHCKDFKLSLDILEQILHVLSKSVTLEELVLENCGLKVDFAQEMAQVLHDHPDSALNTIDLSGNLLEDRGIIALSQVFEQHIKNLRSLSLARTSLSQKGMVALLQSLVSNELFKTSLCHLDLSGNPGCLATEGAAATLFDALAAGCCKSLVHLNLSKNVYSRKKNRNVPLGVSTFFSKASALQYVSLAGTKLPSEALRACLQGLAYNTQLSDLHLDVSSCELRSAGAQVIQDLVADASSISDLNLSDNGFDSDMVTLVLAISRSRSVRHVALGKNFNIRSKETLVDTLHRIVQLTQDDDCSVKSVSVAESRLKWGSSILLDSLGSRSTCLVALDISGNAMGDFGAKMLAKALSVNTTLRTLIWDRNNTTLGGFFDVSRALERNFTLKTMPLPMYDVAQAYRNHPEKMEEVVHKIQSCLTRNLIQDTVPKKGSQLQPDTTASSSEQTVKDACQSVQKHIEMLNSVQDVEVKAEILWAEEAVKDANLSIGAEMPFFSCWQEVCQAESQCGVVVRHAGQRLGVLGSVPDSQILPILHEAGSSSQQSSRLQQKLESLVEEICQTCSREIQATVQAKLEATQNLCPKILQKTGFWDHLICSMPEKAAPDQLLMEVYGKFTEIQLSVTKAMAHAIIDKTLEELTTIQGKLAKNLSKRAKELQMENADWNILQQTQGNFQEAAKEAFQSKKYKIAARWKPDYSTSHQPTVGLNSLLELDFKVEAEDNKIGTPQAELSLSRASTKSRPASTKDAEAGSRLLPRTAPTSAQSLMDLPIAGEKLEHYTRDRPRPNRRNRQPPSKPNQCEGNVITAWIIKRGKILLPLTPHLASEVEAMGSSPGFTVSGLGWRLDGARRLLPCNAELSKTQAPARLFGASTQYMHDIHTGMATMALSDVLVQPPVRENDEDRSIARLDEGLDEFFTKKVIHEHLPPVSLESSLAASISSGSRTFKKKIGHFFAFKKPKSSRGTRPEKEPEGSPSAAWGRKLMISDILKAPSKASESTKALSKSEEGGLAVESRGYLEQSQTPDSARRARPKYSREGKSQSLILLSGEDEEGLGVRHEKKRPFERSDGELPSSFEQRVHVMLHRIGVTKVLSSEGKKKQSKDGEIKKAGSDGEWQLIALLPAVHPFIRFAACTRGYRGLLNRVSSLLFEVTHTFHVHSPTDVAGRTGTEPNGGSSEGRLCWKALGKQLNAELQGKCSEISSSPRKALAMQEPASPREQKERESWSSSLPRTGKSTADPHPVRRTSKAEGESFTELQNSYADVNTIAGDNQLKPKPRLKPVANRRAMSVHEEQLRDQACAAELHLGLAKFEEQEPNTERFTKVYCTLTEALGCYEAIYSEKKKMAVQTTLEAYFKKATPVRSPILKWKIKPKSLLEPDTAALSEFPDMLPQERNMAVTQSKPRAKMEEELQQALEHTLENAQNTALDQRTAVPFAKSHTQEH
ncbi:Capping protein, Arp2/3 and myosin-I linker protein 2 [Varanus komodoensis]|nr:Capping protein, Arp2/3 and myosin-I linker protein 2 [Varanus komodoensis]